MRVLPGPAPHRAGLLWTVPREAFPKVNGLPRTSTLNTVPPGARDPRVQVHLGQVSMVTGLPRTRPQAVAIPPQGIKEVASAKKPS